MRKLKTYLWLDDIRNPDEWIHFNCIRTWVKSYDEFVEHITIHGLPDIISFDHDLAPEHYDDVDCIEKTGYDSVKWLVDYCDVNDLKLPDCRVHSANTVGRENIKFYLLNAKKHLML